MLFKLNITNIVHVPTQNAVVIIYWTHEIELRPFVSALIKVVSIQRTITSNTLFYPETFCFIFTRMGRSSEIIFAI